MADEAQVETPSGPTLSDDDVRRLLGLAELMASLARTIDDLQRAGLPATGLWMELDAVSHECLVVRAEARRRAGEGEARAREQPMVEVENGQTVPASVAEPQTANLKAVVSVRALERAAQAWTTPMTSHLQMDPALVLAVAAILDEMWDEAVGVGPATRD